MRPLACAVMGLLAGLTPTRSIAGVELIRVRTGEHGAITRIVFDLSESAPFTANVANEKTPTLNVTIEAIQAADALAVQPAGLVRTQLPIQGEQLRFALGASARVEQSFALPPDEAHQYARLVVDLSENSNSGGSAVPEKEVLAAESARAAKVSENQAGDGDDNGDEYTFWRDGLSWSPGGGPVAFSLGGRLHLDGAAYDNGLTQHEADIAVRRARAAISMRVGDPLRVRVERDFSGESKGWKNVWASYRFSDRILVRAGNQSVPFSLEAYSSSNTTPFMERSLANAMAPDFLTGGVIVKYGAHYSATLGYFGDALGSSSSNDEGRSYVGRLTVAPINNRDRVLHVGFGVEKRDLDEGAASRVRTRPEMKVGALRMIDTRTIDEIDGYVNFGAEFGLKIDSVVFQAQYMRRANDAPVFDDPVFDGGYIQLSWALTGERRGYSEASGIFTDISPRGRAGAIEAAIRYSMLDLNDRFIDGGRQEDVTLGVNWYLTDYTRFMLNLIHAKANPNRNGEDEAANILGARFQLDLQVAQSAQRATADIGY